jgi:hypothetical protein
VVLFENPQAAYRVSSFPEGLENHVMQYIGDSAPPPLRHDEEMSEFLATDHRATTRPAFSLSDQNRDVGGLENLHPPQVLSLIREGVLVGREDVGEPSQRRCALHPEQQVSVFGSRVPNLYGRGGLPRAFAHSIIVGATRAVGGLGNW